MTLSFPMVLLHLGLALVLGAIIGLERESRDHEAGMRTNALIALGCALFTIISAFGFTDLLGQAHIQLDPTRIASYIIAGIGFLGGGAIFVRQDKERIKGLTTAAAIWVVASIGMACGAGLLWVAVLVTVFALIILVLLRFVEQLLLPKRPSLHHIHLETGAAEKQLVSFVYDICTSNNLLVERVEVHVGQEGGETLDVSCRCKNAAHMASALDALRAIAGIRTVDANLQDGGNA